jgi:hypothetical protein
MNWKMIFPSTVGEAVKLHQLDYNPPGYYYKPITYGQGEVIVTYKYKKGDFYNEHQAKETLFSRELDSYLFSFLERKGLQDSLMKDLEITYGKKFQFVKAASSPKAMMQMSYNMFFLAVDSCVTIGLTSTPDVDRTDRKIAVRFLYNHTPEERISAMRGYL